MRLCWGAWLEASSPGHGGNNGVITPQHCPPSLKRVFTRLTKQPMLLHPGGPRGTWMESPTTLLLSCSPPPVSPPGTVPPALPSQLTLSSRFQSSGWPSLAPLTLLPERLWGRKNQTVNTRKGREREGRAGAGAAQPASPRTSPCSTPGKVTGGRRPCAGVRRGCSARGVPDRVYRASRLPAGPAV